MNGKQCGTSIVSADARARVCLLQSVEPCEECLHVSQPLWLQSDLHDGALLSTPLTTPIRCISTEHHVVSELASAHTYRKGEFSIDFHIYVKEVLYS